MMQWAKEAGEHYGFRCALDADYKIGRNWAGDDAPKAAQQPPRTKAAPEPSKEHGEAIGEAIGAEAAPAPTPPDAGAATARQQPRCLAARLAYATRGWHTFPAPADGSKKSLKAARRSGGRKWGSTTEPDEIRRDCRRWPNANCGVVTGKDSGIFVLEVDTPEGHEVDGIASLRALEARHGPLPPTLTAVSPSGSMHYYFRHPADVSIPNSTSKVAPESTCAATAAWSSHHRACALAKVPMRGAPIRHRSKRRHGWSS
jgi:hypothetical protein